DRRTFAGDRTLGEQEARMTVGMRGRTLTLAGLAALMLAWPGPSAAQGAGAWLHVRVEEPQHQSKVSVNLPVSVVDAALQAAPETVVSDGKIHLGRHWRENRDVSVADLRRAWNELKASGDME